jgi:hypothetical protein
MLTPERLEVTVANDEFIPSTHSSELALSRDGTLIAYASSKRMSAMPKMNSGSAPEDTGQVEDLTGAMPSMAMTEQIYVRPIGQKTPFLNFLEIEFPRDQAHLRASRIDEGHRP